MLFKEYLESRRRSITGSDKEKRLTLIELEAMGIAHRELENARTVASAFVPADKLSISDIMQVQDMLAGLYGLALHELVDRGEIEAPRRQPPEPTPQPLKGGN
jgi:hypothetical protein